jgi:thioredoxin-dependent peroxiredoxin
LPKEQTPENKHEIMKTIRNSLVLLSALTFAFAAQSKPAATSPNVGDKAPLVKGVDQDGNKWKLAGKIGKNVVLLYFYPKDNTPGCTKEACSLRDRIGDLKAEGVEVVGVSFDSVDSHKDFVFKYGLNFPLIADTDGKIADAYAARKGPNQKMDRRVSFLIGLDGKIVHVTDSPSPDVHLEEMQRAIKDLKVKNSL